MKLQVQVPPVQRGQAKRGETHGSELASYMLQATCYMLHATCYKLHATCYMLHTSSYKLQATCFKLNATCYMLQATCYMLHATCFKLQATSYKLHATCYMLHATSYMLQATSYKLQATSYKLQATSYKLHATCYMLQATSYMLHATSYKLHATCYAADQAPGHCIVETCRTVFVTFQFHQNDSCTKRCRLHTRDGAPKLTSHSHLPTLLPHTQTRTTVCSSLPAPRTAYQCAAHSTQHATKHATPFPYLTRGVMLTACAISLHISSCCNMGTCITQSEQSHFLTEGLFLVNLFLVTWVHVSHKVQKWHLSE